MKHIALLNMIVIVVVVVVDNDYGILYDMHTKCSLEYFINLFNQKYGQKHKFTSLSLSVIQLQSGKWTVVFFFSLVRFEKALNEKL